MTALLCLIGSSHLSFVAVEVFRLVQCHRKTYSIFRAFTNNFTVSRELCHGQASINFNSYCSVPQLHACFSSWWGRDRVYLTSHAKQRQMTMPTQLAMLELVCMPRNGVWSTEKIKLLCSPVLWYLYPEDIYFMTNHHLFRLWGVPDQFPDAARIRRVITNILSNTKPLQGPLSRELPWKVKVVQRQALSERRMAQSADVRTFEKK